MKKVRPAVLSAMTAVFLFWQAPTFFVSKTPVWFRVAEWYGRLRPS